MDFMRMRVYGLNDTEMASFKSMLALSSSALNNEWKLMESGQVELHVYSLATTEGKVAWQRHQRGFNAILSSRPAHDQSINFVLKKPLRTRNFIKVLNAVDEQITLSEQKGAKK